MTGSQPRPSRRRRLLNLRVAGVTIAVLATLFFLNLVQVDDDSEAALRASGILVPDLDQVLVARRAEAQSNAWYEYSLLVIAGVGVLTMLGGPLAVRRLAGKIDQPNS